MRQVVQHGEFASHSDGMAKRRDQPTRDQAQACRVLRGGAQERNGIRAVATVWKQIVLGNLDGMEAELVGAPTEVQRLIEVVRSSLLGRIQSWYKVDPETHATLRFRTD